MAGAEGKHFMRLLVMTIVLGVAAGKLPLPRKTNRVIGEGQNIIGIKERPYLVQIRDSDFGIFVCSGTLVDQLHVITAAHCAKGRDPVKDFVVVGGAGTIFDDGVERQIIASFVHPNYGQGNEYANDVAIFKLESPIKGDFITPIGVSFDKIYDAEVLIVSGWGTTRGMAGIEQLRTARAVTIPAEDCAQKYAQGVTSSMICAVEPGKDACEEGFGGPAILRGMLVAISSWNKGCGMYPGIYTSLDSVKDFITESLSK